MSMYSETMSNTPDVSVDFSICDHCCFDCDVYGYCRVDALKDDEQAQQYLNDILKQKGYGGCNIKMDRINRYPTAELYLFNYDATELFAQKVNIELGIELPLIKTQYTMGVKGLNITRCYHRLLEAVDKISSVDQPIDTKHIFSADEIFVKCLMLFEDTVQHCYDINVTDYESIVLLVGAFQNWDLSRLSDGEFYVPDELYLMDTWSLCFMKRWDL